MARVNEVRLRERLARVEALERGATTPGERTAAAAARERLSARLAQVVALDPVRRFVRAHVAALGVPGRVPEPPAHIPSEREVARVLVRWESGDLTRQDVEAWAERIVDTVVLPTESDHEQACLAEVLLQLAMLHRVAIDVSDVPAIRRFLRRRDWAGWFDTVEAAARRGWPVG